LQQIVSLGMDYLTVCIAYPGKGISGLHMVNDTRYTWENLSCTCFSLVPDSTFDITNSPYTPGADRSLARPISRCILFDGENISFDASLLYIYIVLIFLQL